MHGGLPRRTWSETQAPVHSRAFFVPVCSLIFPIDNLDY
jgi:hypothetical protein